MAIQVVFRVTRKSRKAGGPPVGTLVSCPIRKCVKGIMQVTLVGDSAGTAILGRESLKFVRFDNPKPGVVAVEPAVLEVPVEVPSQSALA